MRSLEFSEAIDDALAQEMVVNHRIIVLGEDVQMIRNRLLVRFGEKRILSTPISESGFLGASITAAMAGLRPVVEVMLVDFIGVAMDGLLNHAAKIEAFSGGNWHVPLVIRTTCGGGYGDAGQHEQSLWGWLAHIPGLRIVVPSTPTDAGGLMLQALRENHPVILMEHKLLSANWLRFLGSGGRKTVKFDVPPEGSKGTCPNKWEPIPFGKAIIRREGGDLSMISVGVGVHRCLEAAEFLQNKNIYTEVLDLRSVSPLDKQSIIHTVKKTKHLLVVDEDYRSFGLSGELAAMVLESGISFQFKRVCTNDTIPYARDLENQTLPNTQRILEAALKMVN